MQQSSQQQQQSQSLVKKQAAKPISKPQPDTPSLPLCQKCSTEIPEGASFCPECGEPITEEAIAQTRAEQEAIIKSEPVAEDYQNIDEPEEPEFVEEEPVRKSLLSDRQFSKLMQAGADIDNANKQPAKEAQIEPAATATPAPAPTDPFNLIGTWTCFFLNNFDSKDFGYKVDWQFIESGVLKSIEYPRHKNSWVQNGNSVTVEYNDFVTYELKIINANLMQGKGRDIEGDVKPVELRRQ